MFNTHHKLLNRAINTIHRRVQRRQKVADDTQHRSGKASRKALPSTCIFFFGKDAVWGKG